MQKVVEEAVNLDDVGVFEVALYLDFSCELFDHVFFLEIPFGKDLDGASKSGFFLHGQYYSAVGSLPQFLDDFEPFNGPLLLGDHRVPSSVLLACEEGRRLFLDCLVI